MTSRDRSALPVRQSLGLQCEEILRERILEGTYPPGMRIVETKLSEEFGVSRGPLRAALQALQRDGLVQGDGRGHSSVTVLTADDILHLFEVRSALETIAIQHATARPDRTELADELSKLLDPLRSPTISFANQIAADLRFHERLCAASENPTLVSIWHQLVGQIRIMILAAGPEEAAGRMRVDEHAPLVDAIRAGDVDASAAIMQEHMRLFCTRYAQGAANRGLHFGAGTALLSPQLV